MGGSLRCWDCGQELDAAEIEKQARLEVAAKFMLTLYRDAEVFRSSGDDKTADALESLADQLAAEP